MKATVKMTSHSNCAHAATKAERAKCRKARAQGELTLVAEIVRSAAPITRAEVGLPPAEITAPTQTQAMIADTIADVQAGVPVDFEKTTAQIVEAAARRKGQGRAKLEGTGCTATVKSGPRRGEVCNKTRAHVDTDLCPTHNRSHAIAARATQ